MATFIRFLSDIPSFESCENEDWAESEKGYTAMIASLPLLLGQSQPRHIHLYFEFHNEGGKQNVIKDNRKLIRLNVKNPKLTSNELYNLNTDISEQKNLVAEMPEKVTEPLPLFGQNHVESEWFKLVP